MPTTAKRLEGFTESVIRGMTRKAQQYGAINLSQGFPDENPPEALLQALEKVARGPFHQYAITWGAPSFRQALAQKVQRFTGLQLEPDQHFVVTCGSTEAMMVAMMTVCNPGDQVAIFSPFYENYAADAILSGAHPIYIPLRPPSFTFDPEELEAAFQLGVKALILCNPSNPTGKVFTREELLCILNLAEKYDVFVITDEPYEHLVYEPHQHVHFAALPGAFERTLTCNSLSKTYSITGWRLGYVQAPGKLIAQARKVHDFLTVGAAAPLQEAAVTALNFPDEYYLDLKQRYAKKREVFISELRHAGLPFVEPEGTYFVMFDISRLGFKSDIEASEWFVKDVGVAGVPGSSFFREPVQHYVRFHFARDERILKEAASRIASKCRDRMA